MLTGSVEVADKLVQTCSRIHWPNTNLDLKPHQKTKKSKSTQKNNITGPPPPPKKKKAPGARVGKRDCATGSSRPRSSRLGVTRVYVRLRLVKRGFRFGGFWGLGFRVLGFWVPIRT